MNKYIIHTVREYKWVAYPLSVLILILLTLKYLFGQSGNIIAQITTTQKSVAESSRIAEQLQSKLNTLTDLNQNQLVNDLEWLETVVTADKQIDLVVSELRYSSNQANSQLMSYSTKIGDVVSSESGQFVIAANFAVPDISSLQQLITTLNSKLPLLSINTVQFTGSSASLEINGAWYPLISYSTRIEEPLPDYSNALTSLKFQLGKFSPVPTEAVGTVEESQGEFVPNPNPFTPLAN